MIDALPALSRRDRHYLFILHWLGFDATAIDYEHRAAAQRAELLLAARVCCAMRFSGVVFQTTTLLRWIVYLGFCVSARGRVAGGILHCTRTVARTPPPGWTSLAVLILMIGGFIIISTGVTGLYIGKIFEQVKDRPLYVVDKRVNDERKA